MRTLLKISAVLVLSLFVLFSCKKEVKIDAPAKFSINATSMKFPDTEVGKTNKYKFVITNKGEQALVINKVYLEGANKAAFSHNGKDATILRNKSYTFEANFAPKTVGDKKATLKVASSIDNHSISLTGKATPQLVAKCSVSPQEHIFGAVLIGNKKSIEITVENKGNADLSVSGISLGGQNPNQFTLAGQNEVKIIAPNKTKKFTVSFTPNDNKLSTVSAFVLIKTNVGEFKTTLVGDVVVPQPEVSITPKEHNFQGVVIGESKSQKFLVTNTGKADLVITKAEIVGQDAKQFILVGAEATIAPGANKEYTVTFKPTNMNNTTMMATLKLHTQIGEKNVELTAVPLPAPTPVFSINPQNYDFGGLAIGKTATKDFIVTNTGKADLVISSYKFTEDIPGQFSVTDCKGTIAPKGTKKITVTFHPKTMATSSATLALTTNAGVHKVIVSGMPLPKPMPIFSAIPKDHTFNSTFVGQEESQTITVENKGNAPMTISSISLVGTNPNQFRLENPSSLTSIPVGGSSKLVVVFAPKDASLGGADAKIKFVTNAGEHFVGLSGKILVPQPVFSIAPSSHDFGDVEIGKTVTKDFIVTNTGKADLVISSYKFTEDIPGQFSVTDCKGTIAPKGTKKLTVTFHPKTMATSSATLALTTNAGVHKVIVSGMPLPKPMPIFSATPKDHTFNSTFVGQEESQTITVENKGNAPMTISSISLVGTNPNQFRLEDPSSLTSIPVGGSSKLVVVFAPKDASLAGADAKIKFVTNAGEHFVGLSGKILVPQPVFSIAPSSHDFGDVEIGKTVTKDFIVTNTGKADLIISNYKFTEDIPGQFSVTDCKGTIAPKGTKKLTVTFHPQTMATSSATLALTTNAGVHKVIVSGMPLPKPMPIFSATPKDHTFNATFVGQEESQTITVENKGNAPMTISSISLVGTNSNQFRLENPSSLTNIPVGGSSKLVVVFAPKDVSLAGADAKIKFVTNAGEHFVGLSGKILTQPELKVTPESYDFGVVEVGKNKAITVKLSSVGTAPVSVASIELVDGKDVFTITEPALPLVLQPGKEQDLTLTFTPKDDTKKYTTVSISSNGGDAKINIDGKGKIVSTSTRIRFSNTEMTEAELKKGIVKDGIKLVSADGVLKQEDPYTPAGEYVLHMWPATLDMDVSGKPALKGIKALILTASVPMVFKLLDASKKVLHTQNIETPIVNHSPTEKEVQLTYGSMENVKYVVVSCAEGYIKYITFEH